MDITLKVIFFKRDVYTFAKMILLLCRYDLRKVLYRLNRHQNEIYCIYVPQINNQNVLLQKHLICKVLWLDVTGPQNQRVYRTSGFGIIMCCCQPEAYYLISLPSLRPWSGEICTLTHIMFAKFTYRVFCVSKKFQSFAWHATHTVCSIKHVNGLVAFYCIHCIFIMK